MDRWHPGIAVMIARKYDKENQGDLAARVGLSQGQLSRIENMETSITWDQIQMFSEAQGRDLDWYVYGPAVAGRGDSQRFDQVASVNGHDIAVITKTDEQAAADTFLPRRTFLGGAVKDLRPAPVLSFETPQLALDLAPEDERWLELLFQKVG